MKTLQVLALATTLGVSGLTLQGCGGSQSPELPLPNLNLDLNLPDVDLDIVIELINGLTALLNSTADMLDSAELINNTGLDATLARLTDAANHIQASLADAATAAQNGDTTAAETAISDVFTTLVADDLAATANALASQFGAEFPAAANPFTALATQFDTLLSTVSDGQGNISVANIESASDIAQGALDSLIAAVEVMELLSIAEQSGVSLTAVQDLTGAVIDIPDLVGSDIVVGNAVLDNISPAFTDMSNALLAADADDVPGTFATISSAASSLISATNLGLSGLDTQLTTVASTIDTLDPTGALGLAALIPSLTDLGLPAGLDLSSDPLASVASNLNTSVAALNVADTPQNRQDVINAVDDVVNTVNQVILGLLPQTLDPKYDPIVGAIIALTNLLDNTGGDGQDPTIAQALAGDLDGEATAEAISQAYVAFVDDVFTLVLPLSEVDAELDQALEDAAVAAGNLGTTGLNEVITPVTTILTPIITCLESEAADSAAAELVGTSSTTGCVGT